MSFSDIRRTQPLEVKVFEICPRCDVLKEHVKEHTIIGMWGLTKKTIKCCADCLIPAEVEFRGG